MAVIVAVPVVVEEKVTVHEPVVSEQLAVAPNDPMSAVNVTVPDGTLKVPVEVSVTVAVQVDEPLVVIELGKQDTTVLVVLAVSVIVAVPLLAS